MTTPWHSLYLSCADREALVETLQQSLKHLEYTLYDPFGILPGRAYPLAVRVFAAPPANGWIRIIGAVDPRQFLRLSELGLCLSLALDGAEAVIEVYADGQPAADRVQALTPYLRENAAAHDLEQVLSQVYTATQDKQEGLPLDMLPDDVQQMADNISMKQAQKMFNRLSGRLLKGADEDAARQLLSGNAPDWQSAGGQRIRALMAYLTVPQNWHEPDFVTLRDAYQLHNRRRRNPNAMLYPGDAEAMAKVPNALQYVPVYGGKNT